MYNHILTEGHYSAPKKSKESTISAYTLLHSKSFVHQSSQHRKGPQPQQNNFRCHALPAIEQPCATVNGNKETWFASQDATWPVREQHWFTFLLLVRQGLFPLWGTIKYNMDFSLLSLQVSTADLPGCEFWGWVHVPWKLQSTCGMQKGQTFQPACFPSLVALWRRNSQPDTESLCGQSQHCPLCLSAAPAPAATFSCAFTILQCRHTGRGSLGKHPMSTAKA